MADFAPMMRRRRPSRGFTLTELMTVVLIVGVLATVGVVLLRHHLTASRSTEAIAMIQSIRAAQERWRAETTTYLDVSQSLTSWYPMATPGTRRFHWVQAGEPDSAKWRLLNPTVPGPVMCGYATRAGLPGVQPPALALANAPAWPAAADITEPWYVIQAQADVDGDGEVARYAAVSFTGEVARENDGE